MEASSMPQPRKALSDVLPPLILGTATFNHQYHEDPTHMPYAEIVQRALGHNITAFDTSPYYGPSEILLGDALRQLSPPPPREGYFLITKAGRIASDEFDYSPSWIRYSVCRSLERLNTTYLDLVYMHDVEFVSPAEVLGAVLALRRLRDQGLIRYVGISGYPVDVLASLSELVLRETGEALDAVLSYGHFCVQNSQLGRPRLLARFQAAGVDCVLNASMLGMGLLTSRGVDDLPMAAWHPAPPALRQACHELSAIAAENGEHLEEVAIRWSLQNWLHVGAAFGTKAPICASEAEGGARKTGVAPRLGVSVMGVSAVDQLEETCQLWKSIINPTKPEDFTGSKRKQTTSEIVEQRMWPHLQQWRDYAWQSGGPSFTNARVTMGQVPQDAVSQRWGLIIMPSIGGAKI
ncbi:hypothetical protein K4F52_009266 [Lecanicillium sp. MT-2017a]|nr:hypothetical protein K4F52_009266 [Lecanicillium sp. MT-2017a]